MSDSGRTQPDIQRMKWCQQTPQHQWQVDLERQWPFLKRVTRAKLSSNRQTDWRSRLSRCRIAASIRIACDSAEQNRLTAHEAAANGSTTLSVAAALPENAYWRKNMLCTKSW